MTALADIQAAVRKKCINDTSLMSKVTVIKDHIKASQAFPYIVVGEATESPFNTFNRNGKEITITLHIWSDYKGFKEALDILKRLNTLLDDAELTLAEHELVLMSFDDAQTIREDDLRHIPVTYRIIAQEG